MHYRRSHLPWLLLSCVLVDACPVATSVGTAERKSNSGGAGTSTSISTGSQSVGGDVSLASWADVSGGPSEARIVHPLTAHVTRESASSSARGVGGSGRGGGGQVDKVAAWLDRAAATVPLTVDPLEEQPIVHPPEVRAPKYQRLGNHYPRLGDRRMHRVKATVATYKSRISHCLARASVSNRRGGTFAAPEPSSVSESVEPPSEAARQSCASDFSFVQLQKPNQPLATATTASPAPASSSARTAADVLSGFGRPVGAPPSPRRVRRPTLADLFERSPVHHHAPPVPHDLGASAGVRPPPRPGRRRPTLAEFFQRSP